MPLRIRHILPAGLLLAWLGAEAQPASPPASAAASQPASSPSTAARPNGLSEVLGSVKTTGDDFLPVDVAFRFDALAGGSDQVQLNWEIAEGYYLYRAR